MAEEGEQDEQEAPTRRDPVVKVPADVEGGVVEAPLSVACQWDRRIWRRC